ncbi:uncharacterized protein LOC142231003 [Haematobia irritans]|uniref:uncharacterized protein LOC142231003 n=1 Tax=Haematobia irritans TaxID=7368 RepID=UPI003F5073C0
MYVKILERIIASRLSWFLNTRKLIATNQVAFKHNQGCEDLVHIDYQVTKTLSTKNHASILATDFEKAFDRIGAHIILNTLRSWGVGYKLLNFIKAFLTDRNFRVRINNFYSTNYRLDNGIPQGSPLSVVLFQIAFNQISNVIPNHRNIHHCLYADDLYILSTSKDNENTNVMFSNIITDLFEWCNISEAKISPSKSSILHICRKHRCYSEDICIDDLIFPQVNHLRILGIVFEAKVQKYQCKYPVWIYPQQSCNLSLSRFVKSITTNVVYSQNFNAFTSQHSDWKLLYTDASKYDDNIAYAVVDNTAEAAGIIRAINLAVQTKMKTIICSDSLSVLKAVVNISNCIPGNVYADSAAKEACLAPLTTNPLLERLDLKNCLISKLKDQQNITRTNYKHTHYSLINPNYVTPLYPTNIEKHKIRIFSRLRMGHTIATHQHLLNENANHLCPKCSLIYSVIHIIETCNSIAHYHKAILNNKGMDLLSNPCEENINLIFKFISQLNIKI